MLCQFLLYNEVNQLYVYLYPLPLGPPSHPSPSHPSRSLQSTKLSSLCYAAGSHQLSILFYLFIRNVFILFILIFGCIGSSLLHVDFLQLWRAGATLRCSARASHCIGFSCCGAQAVDVWASVVVARGLSSCGTQAQLLRGMWDLPGPGLEPVSPALARGFLTTAPPGKPSILNMVVYLCQT